MKLSTKDIIRASSLCLSLILTVVAFALFAAPFIQGKLIGTTASGFDLAFNFDSEKNAGLFIAFLGGLLLMVFLVLEAVVFFLIKAKVIKVKVQQPSKAFIIGDILVTLVLYVICGILVFLTVASFEVGDAYSLGGGAIASGLLFIFAGLIYCCGKAYDKLAK